MRRTLALGLVLLVMAIPFAVAKGSADLVSASPVELHGILSTEGPERLLLFHHAFENGSLSANMYNGTIIEKRTFFDCDHRLTTQEAVIYTVSTGQVAGVLHLELGRHAHAVAEYNSGAGLSILHGSVPDASQPLPPPHLLLGPNPYNLTPVREARGWASFGYGDGYFRAFPDTPFVLLPPGDLVVAEKGTLFLESGNFSVTQFGSQRTHEAAPVSDRITCPDFLGQPRSEYRTVVRSYRVELGLAVLTLRQHGLERAMDFYRGERPLGDPLAGTQNPPPRGSWHRNHGEELAWAIDQYGLPSTLLAAQPMILGVEGVAHLRDAVGSVRGGDQVTDYDSEDVALRGTLHLEAVAIQDGGRRMQTQLRGDPMAPQVGAPRSDLDWTPYAAGAAGGLLVAGLLVYAWPGLKWSLTQWFFVPLYARLRREEVLENRLRDGILQVVQTEPGISASELGRRLECGWGTLVYHLTVLERMSLVSSAREGRHKRFFAQGRINYSDKEAVATLANPAARAILDVVRGAPGIIQKDLGERLGLSPGTVAWHAERLVGRGLILREEEGRSVRYYPSEHLLDLTRRLAA